MKIAHEDALREECAIECKRMVYETRIMRDSAKREWCVIARHENDARKENGARWHAKRITHEDVTSTKRT